MDFINTHWPRIQALSREFTEESSSLHRRGQSGIRIWDYFVENYLKVAPQSITEQEIVAFMLYRVATVVEGDEYCGRVKLSTFSGPELYCLHRQLTRSYGIERVMPLEHIRKAPFFINSYKSLKVTLGETSDSVHAHPIWFQDEIRLIRATSCCTMGLQDRALIRAMVNTGARACDLSLIELTIDVAERADFDGIPAVWIRIPNMKNQRSDAAECWLKGDEYQDLVAWIKRRRQIFPESPFLFVTNTGGRISAESVSMSLDTLSMLAGYGSRFFSAHSGRQGYGCRLAARVFSEGNEVSDVYARAGASGLWAPRSSAIARYCDLKVRRFFEGDTRLSWDEFKRLSPEIMHGLTGLEPLLRRAPAWFHHDLGQLRDFASSMGLDLPRDASQYTIRKAVARAITITDKELCAWVQSMHPRYSENSTQRMRDYVHPVVNIMFERELLKPGFRFSDLPEEVRSEIKDDLVFSENSDYRGRTTHSTFNAQRVRRITLEDEVHAEYIRDLYSRRRNDRHVTIARAPEGETVLIRTRNSERNVAEAQLPPHRVVPEQHQNERNPPDTSEPVPPPHTDTDEYVSIPPKTPPAKKRRTFQETRTTCHSHA
jgi:hypothetical protein